MAEEDVMIKRRPYSYQGIAVRAARGLAGSPYMFGVLPSLVTH